MSARVDAVASRVQGALTTRKVSYTFFFVKFNDLPLVLRV